MSRPGDDRPTIGDRLFALPYAEREEALQLKNSDFEIAWRWSVLESQFSDVLYWDQVKPLRYIRPAPPESILESFDLPGPEDLRRLEYTTYGQQILYRATGHRLTIQEYNYLYDTDVQSSIISLLNHQADRASRAVELLGQRDWWEYEVTHTVGGKIATCTVRAIDQAQLANFVRRQQLDLVAFQRVQTSHRYLSDHEYKAIQQTDPVTFAPPTR